MTTCPGNVTISAIATPTGWNGAWRRGTIDSSDVGGADGRPASGISVVDCPLVEAGHRARGDEAGQRAEGRARPLPRRYAAGTRSRSADGTTSKRAGVAPIGSPSTSSGSGSAALIATDEDCRSSTFGCER